jgi:hypothetical protein
MGWFDDAFDAVVSFADTVIDVGAPIVGFVYGGPAGAAAGQALASAVDLEDMLASDDTRTQTECFPPPWTSSPGVSGGGSNSTIDKLFALIAKLQDKLDEEVSKVEQESGGEAPDQLAMAKLQQAFADFNAGVAAASAGIKSFGDVNSGIAQRIA